MQNVKEPIKFGTKAETLERIRYLLTKSCVLDLVYFAAAVWQKRRATCLEKVINLPSHHLIVRSSAVGEDTNIQSMAGKFRTIPNVSRDDLQALVQATDTVFASMYGFNDIISEHQVLIQPMLHNVILSGVAMTRDIATGAPYYCIEYDDRSRQTNTVTQGCAIRQSICLWHETDPSIIELPQIARLLEAIKEIEDIMVDAPLDIEFAIDSYENIIILQVRPLSTQHHWDAQVIQNTDNVLSTIVRFLTTQNVECSNVFGDTAIFSNMADWNPVEMIGSDPRPLAYSIYRYLITRSVWRIARVQMNYHNPVGTELMVRLGMQPFIDVRNSFNSLLPANLPAPFARQLVNAWLERLSTNPELHDKVEFEVAITNYDFSFNQKFHNFYSDIIYNKHFHDFKEKLQQLTYDMVLGSGTASLTNALAQVKKLETVQVKFTHTSFYHRESLIYPRVISYLLGECLEWGTLPFSIIARQAFVAELFLRSLVDRGTISEQSVKLFRESLSTITSELIDSMIEVINNRLSPSTFFERYGHLRPGTYDIRSLRYDQIPEFFESSFTNITQSRVVRAFVLDPLEASAVEQLIESEQMPFNQHQLFEFIHKAIWAREYAKFIFSRHVSAILELIATWGTVLEFDRDELSFLDIDFIPNLLIDSSSYIGDQRKKLQYLLETNKTDYYQKQGLRLNDVIRNVTDVIVLKEQGKRPNFITTRFVRAPVVYLSSFQLVKVNVDDHIVCIESADPGFDWLFSRKIAGLVTQYGGSNSHMGIRCAEFAIPAAIGCGATLFHQLKSARIAELDCGSKRIDFLL